MRRTKVFLKCISYLRCGKKRWRERVTWHRWINQQSKEHVKEHCYNKLPIIGEKICKLLVKLRYYCVCKLLTWKFALFTYEILALQSNFWQLMMTLSLSVCSGSLVVALKMDVFKMKLAFMPICLLIEKYQQDRMSILELAIWNIEASLNLILFIHNWMLHHRFAALKYNNDLAEKNNLNQNFSTVGFLQSVS